MGKAAVKYRRPLNDKQLHLLKLIYKFRFISIELLSSVLKSEKSVVRKRLSTLVDQEYIGRNYDSSYRLQNKHASYYLKPKGISILKAENLDESVLHSMYKDRTASQKFIGHSLDILQTYVQFQKLYKGRFSIYTRSELGQYDQFLAPRPDLYLNGDRDYILELLDASMPFFAVRKLINRYVAHEESGEWEGEYPTVLLVGGSAAQETRLLKYLEQIGDGSDLICLITTAKALGYAKSIKDPIWTSPQDEKIRTL